MGKHNAGTAVFGMSGMGKSWLEGYLIEQSPKQRIILDPKDEHVGLAEAHLIVDRAVMAKATAMGGWYKFWRLVIATGKSVRITVRGLDYDENLDMVDGLARAVHERGNLFFAAGEYHRVAPNKGQIPKNVQILHTDARTCQVDWLISTQRAQNLSPDVVGQANRRLTFKMEDVNDLKRVRTLFRNPDAAQYRTVDEAIMALPPRTCLYINADTSEQIVLRTETLTRRHTHNG